MDISIIIVSWKVRDLLEKNLENIFKSSGNVDFEVFVVDNNSGDGTVEMIARKFPEVHIIANNYNAGFAVANNQAIEMAVGRLVLLLNPDMQVFSNSLFNTVKFMGENNEAGIIGPKLLDANKNILAHVRKFPTFLDQLAIVLKLPHLFPSILDNYLTKDFDYTKRTEVDSIRGSYFVIRREVIDKIGKLDERYFIWFEEVDFCKRAKASGFKILYTPSIECLDFVGKSFSQIKRGKTQKYFRDSMLKYFKKWHPGWQWFLLYLAWPVGMFLAFVADIVGASRKIKT